MRSFSFPVWKGKILRGGILSLLVEKFLEEFFLKFFMDLEIFSGRFFGKLSGRFFWKNFLVWKIFLGKFSGRFSRKFFEKFLRRGN